MPSEGTRGACARRGGGRRLSGLGEALLLEELLLALEQREALLRGHPPRLNHESTDQKKKKTEGST